MLSQHLLFTLYQLVYLLLLLLLAWSCFCPLRGLGQEPGSQTVAFLHLPHPSAHPTRAALYVFITAPDSSGGPSLVVFGSFPFVLCATAKLIVQKCKEPWLDDSVGASSQCTKVTDLILSQESTSKCINEWNNRALFLSLSPSLCLKSIKREKM